MQTALLLVTLYKRASNVTSTTLRPHLYTTYTLRGDNVACKLGIYKPLRYKLDVSKYVSKFIDRAMSEENHRIWGAGVGGWGATKGRRLIYREKFWVWRRKPNMEELLRMWRGREFQVVGAATAKLRNRSMCGHLGQPTNYSLMIEVYDTERTVSIQSEDRQAKQ